MTAKEYLEKLEEIEENSNKRLAFNGYKWFVIGYMFGDGYIYDEVDDEKAKEMMTKIKKVYMDNLDVIMNEWVLPIINEEKEANAIKLCKFVQKIFKE